MPGSVHQLKISVVGIRPEIWRRVLVPSGLSLLALHEVIQAAFGWWDCHLHEFEIGGARYGSDDGDGWGPPPRDESAAMLGSVAGAGDRFAYVYDFGDDWRHCIKVEKVVARKPGVRYPACIAGRRACPPEDCGGVWGYEEFLNAVTDPRHAEHRAMLDWAGGSFDPEEFDPSAFDHRLGLARLIAL